VKKSQKTALFPLKHTQSEKLTLQTRWISCTKCPEWEDSLSRTRVRTPSNSDVVFLLSQVSHSGGKWGVKFVKSQESIAL